MIRFNTVAVSALTVLMGVGVCGSGAAFAQGDQPANDSPQAGNDSAEQVDRDKVTLKDEAQRSIDSANANIDSLKRMASSENGQTRKDHKDMQDKLLMLRNHLQADLTKIDKATANDWSGVRPVVERDLSAMNVELQRAGAVTNLQPPATNQP